MRSRVYALILLVWLVSVTISGHPAQAQSPTVRAVLFFSPDCGHCHELMETGLPPIKEKFGSQLDIVGIDVSQDVGANLYDAALSRFQVPDDRVGVPTLIVGENVLVGAEEVITALPLITEQGLASGGIDWPDIPGLSALLAAQPVTSNNKGTPATEQQTVPDDRPAFLVNFSKDPLANTIAIVVLIGMLASVVSVSYAFVAGKESKLLKWPRWILPVLAILGLGVAAYLSYVEMSGAKAICGPVGNCNSVQQSPYARLFGILPVGVMGMAGYLAILAAWWVSEFAPRKYVTPALRKLCILAIWGMAWFGIAFSIYLTFLEPFVIGATCAWCITSAILMTLIFWISTAPAQAALKLDEPDFEETPEGNQDGELEPGVS